MTGGEQSAPSRARVLETNAELDFAVAGDVRVGRAAGREFVEEMPEHPLAVFRGETHGVQRNAEVLADPARILQVGGGRAVAVFVLVPVAHEQRVHVVAGVFSSTAETAESTPPESPSTTRIGGHARIIAAVEVVSAAGGERRRGSREQVA